MTNKNEIQYIRLYTNGSSACSVDFSTPEKKKRNKTRLPKAQVEQKLMIRLDPAALCGMLVAAVMFIMMLVSCVQLIRAQSQTQAMQAYVAHLQSENTRLQVQYEEGCDLEVVEEMALALGMVPEAQVRHITLETQMPEVVPEPTFWEQVTAFLTGFFA